MKHINTVGISIGMLVVLVSNAMADCANRCCSMCGKKVCVLNVSQEKEKVTCYDVECKEICIPGIKLPWDCKRKCGRVRKVAVLKETSHEKTVCKYDWSIRVICTSCCRKHGLQHGSNCAQVQQDEKVPFPYYAVEVDPQAVVTASAQGPSINPTTSGRALPVSHAGTPQASSRSVRPAQPIQLD